MAFELSSEKSARVKKEMTLVPGQGTQEAEDKQVSSPGVRTQQGRLKQEGRRLQRGQ